MATGEELGVRDQKQIAENERAARVRDRTNLLASQEYYDDCLRSPNLVSLENLTTQRKELAEMQERVAEHERR